MVNRPVKTWLPWNHQVQLSKKGSHTKMCGVKFQNARSQTFTGAEDNSKVLYFFAITIPSKLLSVQ